MNYTLLNVSMGDGSRHFGELPQRVLWYELRDHIEKLDGVTITGFICDDVTEAWIDFTYQECRFSINDQHGMYWFFVEESNCPDAILGEVLRHCGNLLSQGGRT